MTLREYFSGGFVHVVFGFGERLPVIVLFGLVRVDGFGGEQGSLREDARADVESVVVDDALQVGLAVEAAPAQRLERVWIGCNVLDGLVRDRATKELMVMAGPKHPRRFTKEFKRQIVQLCGNGKPASQIRAGYGIPRSTLQRWVQGIRNSCSTGAVDNRTPERNELVEPGKRDRRLEMEVDVSEQAAPAFARRWA